MRIVAISTITATLMGITSLEGQTSGPRRGHLVIHGGGGGAVCREAVVRPLCEEYLDEFGTRDLRWIATTLTPIVPVAGILVIFDRRVDRWTRALLPIWFGVFLAFYSIYGICSDWWDMRFLLPGLPALLVLAMIITPALTSRKLGVTGFDEAEAFRPATIKWAEPQLPKRAVVISGIYSEPFYFYAQRFTARWDLLDTDTYQLLRAYAANANLPWYTATSEVADIKPEEFPKKYPGNWKQLGTYREVTVWRLDE